MRWASPMINTCVGILALHLKQAREAQPKVYAWLSPQILVKRDKAFVS